MYAIVLYVNDAKFKELVPSIYGEIDLAILPSKCLATLKLCSCAYVADL